LSEAVAIGRSFGVRGALTTRIACPKLISVNCRADHPVRIDRLFGMEVFVLRSATLSVDLDSVPSLAGQRVALVGRFAAVPRRQAQRLVREHGGHTVPPDDPSVTLIVVGEATASAELLDDSLNHSSAAREAMRWSETDLWQRLGLMDEQTDARRWYTPAMLAGLIGVDVSKVRYWQRRGLLSAARTVHRLAYFDYSQVAAARQLKDWLDAGVRLADLEIQLASLSRLVAPADHSLSPLCIVAEGRHLVARNGATLIDAGGQQRIDFQISDIDDFSATTVALPVAAPPTDESADSPDSVHQVTLDELLDAAAHHEDAGHLDEAIETCRAAMVAFGAKAEICFTLAELLYRTGDISAARERYYMAVELDEDYVEARSNLGCVLAELGQFELAVAAFEGALRSHGEYPDVHYHLARTLDELGRADEAEVHWRQFVQLSPNNPWSDEARERLAAAR
jgi:tetratricopeptide (TPR) repeat protein